MMIASKSNAIDLQKHCYCVSKVMQLACKNIAFAGIKKTPTHPVHWSLMMLCACNLCCFGVIVL